MFGPLLMLMFSVRSSSRASLIAVSTVRPIAVCAPAVPGAAGGARHFLPRGEPFGVLEGTPQAHEARRQIEQLCRLRQVPLVIAM